jgi:hypothetical protein
MTTLIAIILMSIFIFLSGIHIYWAFGGEWGNGAVIPTKNDDVKAIMPGVIPTIIVASGLLGFAFVVFMSLVKSELILSIWLEMILNYGLWVISGIFIIRAIGEFNYVGFFKKYKHTKFGQNDTKYYSPLCLTIGLLALLLELYK